MSKRQNIITFDSEEVQGEGSWIKIRMITHGQGKTFQKDFGDVVGSELSEVSTERRTEFLSASDQIVIDQVVDWNWVDDDDEPLPLPKDDPTVVDRLTEFEHQFIGSRLQGEGERKK